MRISIIIFLFLFYVCPLIGVGQIDTTSISSINQITVEEEQTSFKNQIDLDVYLLGVEASYKRRISSTLFFGLGIGGFMIKSTLNSDFEIFGGFLEIARIRPFIDIQLSDFFHLEPGIIFAGTFSSTKDDAGYSIGPEIGLFLRLRKIDLGIRPSLLFYKSNDGGNFNIPTIATTLLIIKIPLNRW